MNSLVKARWPNQIRAIEGVKGSFRRGCKFPVIVSPTGTGKSYIIFDMIRLAIERGKSVTVVVHRRILRDQIISQLREEQIEFGVQASGFTPDPSKAVQIAMHQTLIARGLGIFSDLVVWDEVHLQKAEGCTKLQKEIIRMGNHCVGVTATPVDLEVPDDLIQAGTYEESLKIGAHLPLRIYSPDAPDVSKIRPMKGGEYAEKDSDSLFLVPTVFGRVFEHWCKLNPKQLPTILFASSSAAARWWVKEFAEKDIPWGSIDSVRITWSERQSDGKLKVLEFENGTSLKAERARSELFNRYENGYIRGIANRFILREAWDSPKTYCGIIATLMGSVATYLQSTGRIMRTHTDYDHKLLIDHSGVVDRFGVPTIDRNWVLGESTSEVAKKIKDERQQSKEKTESEPICCPKCCAMRTHGNQCPACGHIHKSSIRMVRQINGKLKRVVGRSTKFKKPKDTNSCFKDGLWIAAARNQTLAHAIAVAKSIANKKGIDFNKKDIELKLPQSPEWKKPVVDLFPWLRRKIRNNVKS